MQTHYKLHCPLCKREMERQAINVGAFAHDSIAREIKKEHPQWHQKKGVCPVCLDYYERIYLCEISQ